MSRKYRNNVPVSDLAKVLLLLVGEWGDKTNRSLKTPENEPPFIEVNHYGGHYDEWQSSTNYLIDSKIVEQMKIEGLVAGTPRWGYTDEKELRITEGGRDLAYPRRTGNST